MAMVMSFEFGFNEAPEFLDFQNHIVFNEDEITSVPHMISDVEIRGWGSGGMINPTSDSVSLEILNYKKLDNLQSIQFNFSIYSIE